MIHCVNANASTGEAITENSIPNLDDWGWDDYWKIDDWIEWHKIMKEKNGLDAANTKFLTYWNKQSTGANPIDARSFDSNFRDYARKNKFFDNLFSGVGWIKPIGAATDVISSGSDVVSNIGSAIEKSSNILKIALPLALVAATIIGGIWAYKKYAT